MLPIKFPVESLPSRAINYIKRLAAFKNPKFYARLGMKLPTYNLPRIISCADFIGNYLLMPRGCEEAIADFFKNNGVDVEIEGKTNHGTAIDVKFLGDTISGHKYYTPPG